MMSIIIIVLSVFCNFSIVGDLGNPPLSNGYGKVDYDYEIMSYEVTNEEYCLFLNSVASSEDEYGLYSPIMSESFMGGIIQDFKDGELLYFVKKGYENKPVIGVTWYSAIRYINWLHYNAPQIEANNEIDLYTTNTEGDSYRGAYNTIDGSYLRNPGAIYWLPNRNEWIKAAFYWGDHWNESFVAEGSNCYSNQSGWAYPCPHIKDVGQNVDSSYYGLYDTRGNVAEWVEDRMGDFRLSLGGSLIRAERYGNINETEGDYPDKSISSFGFRVCRTANVADRLKEVQQFNSAKSHTTDSIIHQVSFVKDSNGGIYVMIDCPNNIGDLQNRFKGSVAYEFYISRYELTNREYCEFLNHVAVEDDLYGLYDENMGSGICGGILRVQENGKYRYLVKEKFGNRPVTYVGFYELARYCNWLHYGCPYGHQIVGITEGTDKSGAYDTHDFETVRYQKKASYANFGRRNQGAKFWIPDEDEWYKAAYYDPMKIGNRKYHDYPTRTSDPPLSSDANYMIGDHYVVGAPYYIAEVDSFSNSPSYFGTLQQGGNVWEWTESWQYGVIGSRALRGGSWQYTEYGLNAVNEDPGGINDKSYLYGGRICMAVDSVGFKKTSIPFCDKLYKQIALIPRKHFIYMVLFGICLMIILFGVSIYSIYRWRSYRK